MLLLVCVYPCLFAGQKCFKTSRISHIQLKNHINMSALSIQRERNLENYRLNLAVRPLRLDDVSLFCWCQPLFVCFTIKTVFEVKTGSWQTILFAVSWTITAFNYWRKIIRLAQIKKYKFGVHIFNTLFIYAAVTSLKNSLDNWKMTAARTFACITGFFSELHLHRRGISNNFTILTSLHGRREVLNLFSVLHGGHAYDLRYMKSIKMYLEFLCCREMFVKENQRVGKGKSSNLPWKIARFHIFERIHY